MSDHKTSISTVCAPLIVAALMSGASAGHCQTGSGLPQPGPDAYAPQVDGNALAFDAIRGAIQDGVHALTSRFTEAGKNETAIETVENCLNIGADALYSKDDFAAALQGVLQWQQDHASELKDSGNADLGAYYQLKITLLNRIDAIQAALAGAKKDNTPGNEASAQREIETLARQAGVLRADIQFYVGIGKAYLENKDAGQAKRIGAAIQTLSETGDFDKARAAL